ncbi:MAG: pirin family protein [Rhodococcus sp.]|uniref:pirin-like C-terminal cupin domain-containing protein n=1 Tax=Rhodococcus sp. TaxID=1831 RepID=UPI0016958E0D|nr:pirin-like C-terminal cupin domain-containing protein [Rhodococcus sp. (in: high G+C Gram-positive bacteria)]NLV79201.1 pirin family protein [Rhodococcus sp. (in: high G+C Gram-positive bacteria)]
MTSAGSPVLQVFELGSPWQTIDPFLFVAHHVDDYPAGNGAMGPDAPLDGRPLGQDFGNPAGWNMYHGTVVPGFPGHPYRGFETVTFVRSGFVDHSDSVGASARFGDGDTPTVTFDDDAGRTASVRVLAGTLGGTTAPPPPPDSWASRPDTDVAIWSIDLSAGARWEIPPAAGADTQRVLYVYDGAPVTIGGRPVTAGHGAVVDASMPLPVTGGADTTRILLLQGRPIREPVVSYGPFVLTDEAGVRQAFADYRRTGFGGWPWDDDGPVHSVDAGRFARYPDGHIEKP